ncbi:MAG: metal ABC transporter permease [Candidatus Kapabacteria bacterium]|nr:metal ABC transporter permease [Candidatus Kapabacteria bacterium]
MFEIFAIPFMQRALIAGVLIGFIGSYYGVFVVQRKMSFLGDGLAHAAFGGIALGILLDTEPLLIAIPFTILVSVGIVILKNRTKLESDTAIGISFAVSVALGIIFLSIKKGYSSDAMNYLFGSILSVFPNDLYIVSGLSIFTIITFFTHWNSWAYATFDSELARSDGQKIFSRDIYQSILISLTIVVSIKVVGIVLIASFLIIPAAAARLVSSTFYGMTVKSIIFGILSAVSGLWLSYYLDVPSGATIILVQALIFTICAVAGRQR